MKTIWTDPKTTIGGLLVGIVLVANVLTTHGVQLGHIGTTDWITLVGALAAAVGGCLAKDPAK